MHLGVGPFRQPQAVVADQHPRAVDQRCIQPSWEPSKANDMKCSSQSSGVIVALAGGHDMGDQRTGDTATPLGMPVEPEV